MTPRTWFVAALVAVLLATSVLSPFAHAQTAPAAAAVPAPENASEPTTGEVTGSVASNVFYAPGKFFRCVTGGALWFVAMAITFGTVYDDAARLVQGACGGKWTLDDADIREATKPVPGSDMSNRP